MKRREFLKSAAGAGAASSWLTGPAALLFESIIMGHAEKSYAQMAGLNPRTYVNLLFRGGPPTWTFNLFLTPYGNNGFIRNATLGTRYSAVNGRYTDVEYVTALIKGIQVPHLWTLDTPKAGGGVRPLSDLLDNLLNIQGIDTGDAGHTGSVNKQEVPLGALQSVSALSADASSALLPAVSTYGGIRSRKGKTAVVLEGGAGNLAREMLGPFIRTGVSAEYLTNRNRLDVATTRALSALDKFAASSHPMAAAISDDRSRAQSLIESNFADLDANWNTLLAKYQDLIRRGLDAQTSILPGINDLPIGTTGTRNGKYLLERIIQTTDDLRSLMGPNVTTVSTAAQFALIEFVLMRQLSQSISIKPLQVTGLNTAAAGGGSSFDEHFTGAMPTLLINTFYYRAIGACLIELIDQLKARNLYNDTVISLMGDFSRTPQESGFGSDHAPWATAATLFSGAINGPIVIGNTLAKAPDRPSTWGYQAPIEALGGALLDCGHRASSIATILRVPSPVTAKPSLLKEENGKIVPIIEKARLIV